jgi:hypothetical protein
MVNISQLKPGDTVRHVESGNSYTVEEIYGGRVFAVRQIEISNPDEWILVDHVSINAVTPLSKIGKLFEKYRDKRRSLK